MDLRNSTRHARYFPLCGTEGGPLHVRLGNPNLLAFTLFSPSERSASVIDGIVVEPHLLRGRLLLRGFTVLGVTDQVGPSVCSRYLLFKLLNGVIPQIERNSVQHVFGR